MRTLQTPEKEKGLTLVELMISITLGLMLVAVVLSVFLSANRNYTENERLARMQENARFAMNLLVQDLSMAGFWGTVVTPSSITGVFNHCNVNFNGATSLSLMVLADTATATHATNGYDCIDSAAFKSGTDVLLIKRAQGIQSLAAAGADSLAYDGNKLYLRISSAGAAVEKTTTPDFATATYWEFIAHLYYINNYAVPAASGVGQEKVPSLYRKTVNTSNQLVDEPLVEGIEHFHVAFGIDTDDDGIANRYKDDPTAAELRNAINARVYLLVRSVDKDPTFNDTKTYRLGNRCFNVAGTGGCAALTDDSDNSKPAQFYRRVYSSTVSLRNPANTAAFSP